VVVPHAERCEYKITRIEAIMSTSYVDLSERVRDILLSPARTWRSLSSEPTSARQLYRSYAAILAALPAVAHILGATLVGSSFLGIRYRAPFSSALGYAISFYLLSLVGIYGYARVIDALAPVFHSEKRPGGALKLAVYSSTPTWVSGVLLIVPALARVSLLLSLYSFYLFYLGLLPLMNTPERHRIPYSVAAAVIGLIIWAAVGLLAGFIFPAGSIGIV
jgi:hypothetical protein